MAAEMTVTTLLHTIWREAVGVVCWLMGVGPYAGCNLSEKAGTIKGK
jgi:hypothetical protein